METINGFQLTMALVGVTGNLLLWRLFEITQQVSIWLEQIPQRHSKDVDHWHDGKPFLYWKAFLTQRLGDPLFFSILDGCLFAVWAGMQWTTQMELLATRVLAASLALNILQILSVSRNFAAGKFPRWGDWGFGEKGRITIAGVYHCLYATLQTWAIAMSLITHFYWRATSPDTAFGIGFSIAGYIATWCVDNWGKYTGFSLPAIPPPRSQQETKNE